MGEILGLGLSHAPGTRGTDDAMAGILRRTLQRPDVPDWWKDPKNWPKAMQEEWGDDEGRSAAPIHRAEFVKHCRMLRKALDDFKPDFIVMWGDDQYENFREDIIPPFCIYAYEDLEIYPYRPRRDRLAAPPTQGAEAARAGAFANPENAWGEPPDTKFLIRGKREAAKYLARGLLEEKIDMPYAYQPLHYEGLSHAFLNAVLYLDYDRQGFDYPVVPMPVNCYGSRIIVNHGGQFPVGSLSVPVSEGDLDPPSPSPERCMEVGAAVVRVLKRSPWKVAIAASSSWSHAFLTAKHYFVYPDIERDRQLWEGLLHGDYDLWRKTTTQQVEEAGEQEVLNWWVLLGAMEELGHKGPDYHGYIESYVMNSPRAFALYNPR